jgi:hypothetical protein
VEVNQNLTIGAQAQPVSNVKVIFTPSTEFKANFARVSFERAQNAEKTTTDGGGIVKPKV